MKKCFLHILVVAVLAVFVQLQPAYASPEDGTIDPNAVGNQNAWSNNIGWINFEVDDPASEIHITDAGFTGYAWSQNYGWINMNPTGSGVLVASDGTLSGSAWGENTGYIDFSTVSIDANGLFAGTATGTVVGTINFDCANCVVETDYRPDDFQSSGRRRELPADPSDIDGDGIPNDQDPDMDGDGVVNIFDPDVDGDGVLNGLDSDDDADGSPDGSDSSPSGPGESGDLDGDGTPDDQDSDMDGDGIPNASDPDMDGDGAGNGQDPDMDGDGKVNALDDDTDGDGEGNGSDTDDDGDGIPDEIDPIPAGFGALGDLDGDGTPDAEDSDIDGDGVPNIEDDDENGDGLPDGSEAQAAPSSPAETQGSDGEGSATESASATDGQASQSGGDRRSQEGLEALWEVLGAGSGGASIVLCEPGELDRDIRQIQGSVNALERLTNWVYPEDYQVTFANRRKEQQIKDLYFEKFVVQSLGEQVCSYVPFVYQKPELKYLANMAELSKSLVLSFSFCFDPQEVVSAVIRDVEEGGERWWEEYDAILKPFWEFFFDEVYSESDSIQGRLMTSVINSLLLDYCPANGL